MTYKSPYGRLDGLEGQLEEWAHRLCTQEFPWEGTGIVADLKAAVRYIKGERTDAPEPDIEPDLGSIDNVTPSGSMEWDL